MVASSGFAYMLRILLSEGICRIAVPSFFLISGYLFFKGIEQWDTKRWANKMKRRLRTLLVPYVLWNLLGVAYLCITPYVGAETENGGTLIQFFQERGWLRLFWDSKRIMEQWSPPGINFLGITMHNGMPANTPLWFIRDLIVINIFSPLVFVWVKHAREYGLCLLCILFVLNIWIPYEGFSVIGVLFYSFGAYLSIFSKSLVLTLKKVRTASYFGATLFLILLIISFGHHWAAPYVQRLFQIAGVVAGFNLAASLIRNENSHLIRLADSSFFVYASHFIIISAVTFLMVKVFPAASQTFLAVKYLLSAAITVLLCEGFFQLMNKVCPRLLSFLCGNRQTNQTRQNI